VLPPEWFRNKIVLIGAELSITDRHRTPYDVIDTGQSSGLPGIVIQAHGIAQLLDDRSPPYVGWWANLGIAAALALLGASVGLIELSIPLRIAVGGAVLAVLWSIGGGVLFRYAGISIALVTPSLSFVASIWGTEAFAGREARRQRRFIEKAFASYVPPTVVDRLVKDPSKLQIEGERRTMTFIFTDLAGFTSMSEVLDSHELAQLLNAYLAGVCEIVDKYEGTVDKFIGDAVFAFFNAPIDQPDHAALAVRCGLEIDEFAERFRAEHIAKNIPLGVTRIGIHTGEATVGNYGTQRKRAYTAVGDTVNAASRIEGVNKTFGTRLIISETTLSQCRDIPVRPLGRVRVKGKTTAIGLFQPLHEAEAKSDYMRRYNEAFRLMEAGDPRAETLFAELLDENPYDQCVTLHLQRLERREATEEIALMEK
jgi:adenylate cyclase